MGHFYHIKSGDEIIKTIWSECPDTSLEDFLMYNIHYLFEVTIELTDESKRQIQTETDTENIYP